MTKDKLVELVMDRLSNPARNGVVAPKKWQVEIAVNTVLDSICDALAERRPVKFLNRFAMLPKLRKGGKRRVPAVIGSADKATVEVEIPDRYYVTVKLGGWLKKRIAVGRKPTFWGRYGV